MFMLLIVVLGIIAVIIVKIVKKNKSIKIPQPPVNGVRLLQPCG